MSDNPNKKTPLNNAMQGLRASQERLESLTAPMFEQIEHLGRIAKAIANPFGESIEPTANTPTVIEHKPPMPNHHNSPALRTLTSIATAKDDEKTEKQILLKIIERLIEKPANETSAKLAEMPLVANTLTLQASEITSLKDQLDQKEQKINELQAQIDQLQATATPATNSNDKELPTRTANNAGKIISALAVELLELDITKPYGEANKNIRTAVELQGNTISDDTVATWLKIAHETSK